MDDGAPCAGDRLEGAGDELGARLGEHLDGDVGGNQLLVDEHPNEIEIGLRGGGKADLDLLEAEADEEIEHATLAFRPHRLDQRLVTVPETHAAPDPRGLEAARPPAAVRRGEAGTR